MTIKQSTTLFFSCLLLATACSKKHQPQTAIIDTTETSTVVKAPVRKPVKTPVPKIITVDDRAAKKSAEGRLYYDLEGKRYWKNYNDGKYYIFKHNLFADAAFTPH